MTDSIYKPFKKFVLKLKPDRYMDFIGHSEPLKILIISKNIENHIIYAYNNSFFHFFGIDPPSNEIYILD